MNRRAASLLVLLALLSASACKRAPEPPPPRPSRASQSEAIPIATPVQDIDSDNLLNVTYGAAVVSRTGELNLETSAMNAIDGMSPTLWTSAPDGASQTLVFAFGGPSRVEQLGVTTTLKDQAPEKVRFSASSNGRSWREIATMQPADRGTKIVDVKPFEARYLRVETIESKEYYAALASVHAIGREIAAPRRHSFEGCWNVNTFPAIFVQRGARITGVLMGPRQPTYVDGGVEGRVAKLMWIRGTMWGYAAATLTPDGSGISAVTFYEEPIFNQVGEAWIGSRCQKPAETVAPLAPADFLRRAGRWTMSGVAFDRENRLLEEPSRDTLDAAATLIRSAPAQRFRIIAREFRENDPAANLRITTSRIEAIRAALRARSIDLSRVDLVAEGSKRPDTDTPSATQRMMWSRIDLETVKR
ncbi:MAG: discoidin domain-containing protein [Thermoanaerobaculia bacterium]